MIMEQQRLVLDSNTTTKGYQAYGDAIGSN